MKADASPASRRLLDTRRFSRSDPGASKSLPEVDAVFVGVFEHQRPAQHQRDRLLCRNAEQGCSTLNAGDLAGDPTSARVIVIPMRVEEQQILLDAIQAKQHLRVSVGDESQNGTR